MKNMIAIIAGEPNSINSEIIAKAWKNKKKTKKYICYWKLFYFKETDSKIRYKNSNS